MCGLDGQGLGEVGLQRGDFEEGGFGGSVNVRKGGGLSWV